jgi:OHCU decarboxylase
MNPILTAWNRAAAQEALDPMLACCGSRRWATEMIALRPFESVDQLIEAADIAWSKTSEPDWLEAFACHPRIGERGPANTESRAASWSRQEQSSTESANAGVLVAIANGNAAYEKQFGFTYIVSATGKSANEMLAILNRRLENDRATELLEAAGQQWQITQIRLGKWAST